MLDRAEHVVIVRSISTSEDAPIEGRAGSVYVNAALRRIRPERFDAIAPELAEAPGADSSLRQWEWGEALYRAVPELWRRYLCWNGVPPTGLALNGYWIAHPPYERAAGLIPFPFYAFSVVEPLVAAELSESQIVSDRSEGRFCAFLTTAGSDRNGLEVRTLLEQSGHSEDFWFTLGYDAPDAVCVDVFGEPAARPYEKVGQWLADAPFRGVEWKPLDLDVVLGLSPNRSLKTG